MYTVEKEFEYKGFACAITFTEMGFYCGFVRIPEDHKLYGQSFTYINDNVDEVTEKLSCAGFDAYQQDGYWLGITMDGKGIKPDLDKVKEKWGEHSLAFYLYRMSALSPLLQEKQLGSIELVGKHLKILVDEIGDM